MTFYTPVSTLSPEQISRLVTSDYLHRKVIVVVKVHEKK